MEDDPSHVPESALTIREHIIVRYWGRWERAQRPFRVFKSDPLTAAVDPGSPPHCGGRALHRLSSQDTRGTWLCQSCQGATKEPGMKHWSSNIVLGFNVYFRRMNTFYSKVSCIQDFQWVSLLIKIEPFLHRDINSRFLISSVSKTSVHRLYLILQ